MTANDIRRWRQEIYEALTGIPIGDDNEACICAETIEAILDEMHEAELDLTRAEVRSELEAAAQ